MLDGLGVEKGLLGSELRIYLLRKLFARLTCVRKEHRLSHSEVSTTRVENIVQTTVRIDPRRSCVEPASPARSVSMFFIGETPRHSPVCLKGMPLTISPTRAGDSPETLPGIRARHRAIASHKSP